jgi:hypothetical protein
MVTNIDNNNNYNLFCYIDLSSIYAPCRSYLWGIVWRIVTRSCITGSREPEPEMKGRYFPPLFSRISRAFFSPGFCRFFSGTSLDSMYEQWNCESNMYWITIVLLPAIAMLSHFLNPWLITALTGTPVSINNEVFQTEEIYIIVCCLIKDLSLLFYYFKYYTIHMGFNTLF